MPETKNYVFDHTEVAEMMIKKVGIHEGMWGIYLEFTQMGANVPMPDGKNISPAAITFIKSIGIQRFDKPNNLTVDAAEVNPEKPEKPTAKPLSRH